MRIWVSSPSIEWNSPLPRCVDLKEHIWTHPQCDFSQLTPQNHSLPSPIPPPPKKNFAQVEGFESDFFYKANKWFRIATTTPDLPPPLGFSQTPCPGNV